MSRCVAFFALVTFLLLATSARGVEPATKAAAKTILAKYKDALVLVKVTVNDRAVKGAERQLEMYGTVGSSSGLTVVSNWESLDKPFYDEEFDETKTFDASLVLKDGREVPAQFVLRDRDLDLAFLRPVETNLKLPHVSMVKAPLPKLLDDLLVVYHLGKA